MLAIKNRANTSKQQNKGFTLIEIISGILILSIALSALAVVVFPMLKQTAHPYHQARAAALGQAVLSELMARQFDVNSDANGSRWRCGEDTQALALTGISTPDEIPACSQPLQQNTEFGFISVNDYIGCWGDDLQVCMQNYRGSLENLLINHQVTDYIGLNIDITVNYVSLVEDDASSYLHKRIDLKINAGQYGSYAYSAYRSNY